MRPVRKIYLPFLVSLLLSSCFRDNEASLYPEKDTPGSANCDTNNVSYTTTISPILMHNCALAGCHSSASPLGGYTLDNYLGVRSIVLSGRLIGAINHMAGYSQMPKNTLKLNECYIGQITSWVNQGAQNN